MKLVTDLERQPGPSVPLEPQDFGLLVDGTFLVTHSLGTADGTIRNLP